MNIVKVREVDRKILDEALLRYMERVTGEYPEVIGIVLYGSFAKGNFTPLSDVDILLVLKSSDRSILERISDFIDPYFPFSIDVIPYTLKELKHIFKTRPRFKEEILSNGKILWGEKEFMDLLGS